MCWTRCGISRSASTTGYDSERHGRLDRHSKPVRPGSYPKRVGRERPTRLFIGAGCRNIDPDAQGFILGASLRSLALSGALAGSRINRVRIAPVGRSSRVQAVLLSRALCSRFTAPDRMWHPRTIWLTAAAQRANEIGRGTFDPCPMPTAPTPSIIIDPALAIRIACVEQMWPRELREVYRHTFGRDTTSGNRAWLVGAITTRL